MADLLRVAGNIGRRSVGMSHPADPIPPDLLAGTSMQQLDIAGVVNPPQNLSNLCIGSIRIGEAGSR